MITYRVELPDVHEGFGVLAAHKEPCGHGCDNQRTQYTRTHAHGLLSNASTACLPGCMAAWPANMSLAVTVYSTHGGCPQHEMRHVAAGKGKEHHGAPSHAITDHSRHSPSLAPRCPPCTCGWCSLIRGPSSGSCGLSGLSCPLCSPPMRSPPSPSCRCYTVRAHTHVRRLSRVRDQRRLSRVRDQHRWCLRDLQRPQCGWPCAGAWVHPRAA